MWLGIKSEYLQIKSSRVPEFYEWEIGSPFKYNHQEDIEIIVLKHVLPVDSHSVVCIWSEEEVLQWRE